MRKLIFILLLFSSLTALAQSEANNMVFVDTLIAVTNASNNGNGTGGLQWRVRAWIHRDTLSYPTILFMPGAGQIQTGNITTDTTSIHSFGPNFWQQQINWDATVTLGNGVHRPNILTILQPAANMRPWYVLGLFQRLDAIYHPLHHYFYGSGFSEGAYIWDQQIPYSNNVANNDSSMRWLKALVDLQGVNPDTTVSPFTFGYNGFNRWANLYGGKFWGIEGTSDTRNVWQLSQPANTGSAGSAYFTYSGYGGGTHGGSGSDGISWNWNMDPRVTDWQNTGTITNSGLTNPGGPSNTAGTYVKPENLYQWMLRQGDTTLVGGGSFNQPTHPPFKWAITSSEYTTPAIDSTFRPVLFSTNKSLRGNGSAGTGGVPVALTVSGVTFWQTSNTLHGGLFLGSDGFAYSNGGNAQGECGLGNLTTPITTLTKIAVDARGLPFTPISYVQGYYAQIGAVQAAGAYFVKWGAAGDTIFVTGNRALGMGINNSSGNDTVTAPTVGWAVPAGHHVIQMAAEVVGAALLDDGTLYTWGAGGDTSYLGRTGSGTFYATPGQVTGFADSVRQVVGGAAPGLLILSKTKLYHIGPYGGYAGFANNPAQSTPTDLVDSVMAYILNGTTRTSLTMIAGNSNCFHAIANDGTLWGWGDNGMGSIGNGVEPNMVSPGGTSLPWFIDPSQILVLPQTHPVQVTKKSNFVYIASGALFSFTEFALDATGQLYACGRNKGGVLPNGIVECTGANGDIQANYPNSWDLPYLTPVNPYGVTSAVGESCLGCKTGAVTSFCSECTIPTTTPSANAGSTQNLAGGTITTTLDGSGSTSTGGNLTYYLWTQTSGAASTIDVPAAVKPNISGLTTGSYIYNLKVTDNGFNTSNQTVTVNVGFIAPTVNAGSPQTITLPTSSVNLSGSASGNGGATIASVLWTKVSGPGSTTISGNTTLTPTASGLQQGTYVFNLHAVDSNGATNDSTVTITVNAAPANSACCKFSRPFRIITN